MAQKRMFSNLVIGCDDFLEMPDSSQNLYFHLSMQADDDGFVGNWKSIMKMTGKKEDDLKLLIAKSFILPFDSGVLVIKHWKVNNYIQKDRYKETIYKDEKGLLSTDENNVYNLYTECIHSIDKNRLDKSSIEKNINNTPVKIQNDKKHFAEFVTMTNEEYEKLCITYSKEFADQCITFLDNYKGANGRKYKSDYRAILNWVVGAVQEHNRKNGKTNINQSPINNLEEMRKKYEKEGY